MAQEAPGKTSDYKALSPVSERNGREAELRAIHQGWQAQECCTADGGEERAVRWGRWRQPSPAPAVV